MPSRDQWRRAFILLTLLAVSQTLWNGAVAAQWTEYLALFRRELSAHNGLIRYEASLLSRETVDGRPVSAFNWGWTMPTMSLLLAPGGRVRTILRNPREWEGWEPFDPTYVATFPKLERYGILYDGYQTGTR